MLPVQIGCVFIGPFIQDFILSGSSGVLKRVVEMIHLTSNTNLLGVLGICTISIGTVGT